MKYVPNVLTCCRILGSIVLLLLKPLTAFFIIIYIVCGATDFFDGYIARKTKNISKSGATLDSIADIIFIAVMFFVLIPLITLAAWVIIWIIGIVFVRIVSYIIGFAKYKAFTSLHTYANKATGLMLFSLPILIMICGIKNAEIILLTIASLSALEEITINVTSQALNVNIKSIFQNKHSMSLRRKN